MSRPLDLPAGSAVALEEAVSEDGHRLIHSGRGGRRLRLVSDRLRFASSRRRRDAFVGRVGRRTTGGTTASRRRAARRCLAAVRFRCCERCSAASMVSTVPVVLSARCSRARARWVSLRADVVPRSKLSCTRESVVLTPCPPGPDARENCSTSSAAGTVRPRGAPGPGRTCRSFTHTSVPQKGSSQSWSEIAGGHRNWTKARMGLFKSRISMNPSAS